MVGKLSLDPTLPELIGLRYIKETSPQKILTINGTAISTTINLEQISATANMKQFLKTLSDTKDVGLLTNWLTAVQFMAYTPHLYFFVLPMCIGDCHSGLGNLEEARESYSSVMAYPFINENYEIVKVWTRLAQTYLDLGDQAYRNAKDIVAGYAVAKTFYEAIVLVNRAINDASPLYADVRFADIKTPVTSFMNSPDSTQVDDNPVILSIVSDAFSKLQQIESGLNFFGFGLNYLPPFSSSIYRTRLAILPSMHRRLNNVTSSIRAKPKTKNSGASSCPSRWRLPAKL